MKYLFTILLCVIGWSSIAQNNAFEGNEFYLTALRPSSSFGSLDNQVVLWSRTSATVTISNAAKSFSTVVSLTANTPIAVTLPAAASNHSSNNVETVQAYGIEIKSNNNISVLLNSLINNNQSDGTMVYPTQNLGTEYYAMSYEATGGGFNAGASALIVVATQNSTLVEITPSVATTGSKLAGTPFTVTLNKGETYRLEGGNGTDITGTRVRVLNGCKKIAVFSGSSCSQIPASCTNCGHLVEMMPHLDTWGKKFVIAQYSGNSFQAPQYSYSILSITNGTKVTINGTTKTLNKGDIEIANNIGGSTSTSIEASNPVLVAQFMEGFGCQGGAEPRMSIISPLEQMVTSALVTPQNINLFGVSNRVLIVTKTNSRQRVRLNGALLPIASFSTFTTFNDWSYADVMLNTTGTQSITSDSGFVAYLYFNNFNFAYSYQAAANMRIKNYDVGIKPQVCGATQINFYNTGDSSKIANSKWIFSDNTTQNGKSVTKDFGKHGIYNVANVVTYTDECPYTDTINYNIKTLQNPKAGFSVSDTAQCFLGNNFSFTDTSKYFNLSAKQTTSWFFADTNIIFKNQTTINRVFSAPGIIPVKIIATSTDNCSDTFTRNIIVNPNPKAGYQLSNPQCFKGHLFKPTQTSAVSTGSIATYEWDFGDSTTSLLASPSKTYSNPDTTYPIRLIIATNAGCGDTLYKSFTILPSPTAAITAPASICSNDSFKAINNSVFALGALSYFWELGDGTLSNQPNITKTYADTGTYNIVLRATTPAGCVDSVNTKLKVLPTPKPNFSYVKDCSQNATTYTNTTFDYGFSAATYNWNVGDSTYNTKNVNHIYKNKGLYAVKLFATLPNGCNDSAKQNVYINPTPSVDFIINDSLQCIRNNNFDFFNNTVISEGKINTFTWKLNDTFWSNNTSINQVFSTFGKFKVKLIAQTDSACADSIEKQFEVAPQTSISLVSDKDTQCFKNHSFPLVNNSSLASGVVKYQWIYSNNDIDTLANPGNKTFTSPGKYQLLLLAITDKGCRDSTIKNLTLYPSPELDFEVNDVCGTDSARFFNPSKVSTGRIISWDWDLGDGSTSTDKQPIHHYNNFGYYAARLIGITDLGCPDTLFKDSVVKVKPAPTSFFNTELVSQRGDQTIYNFIDLSKGADNFFWNFDRGQTSRENNPTFIFTDTGTYNIVLSVSNNDGCFSYYDTTITIVPDIDIYVPNAFSPNKDLINPTYRIEGSYYYLEFEMHIYDRWGQQVFYSNNPENGWDGSYDGKRMPEGVYVYYIRIISTDTKVRNYKGNLHLFR